MTIYELCENLGKLPETYSAASSYIQQHTQDIAHLGETLIHFSTFLTSPASDNIYANYNKFVDGLSALAEVLGKWAVNLDESDDGVSIAEDTLASLREIAPIVPEEQREVFEEIVAPISGQKSKLLTPENFLGLLMLLVEIVSIIISSRPQSFDEETKQISRERNEIMRSIASSLEKGDAEDTTSEPENDFLKDEFFKEFFEYLDDNGFVIAERLEPVAELLEPVSEQSDVVMHQNQQLVDTINPERQDDALYEQNCNPDSQK